MPKIPDEYIIGQRESMTVDDLVKELEEMYRQLADAINQKPSVVQRTIDGQGTETFLSNGDININLTSNKVEMVTNHPTQSTVTWTELS